MRSYAVVIAFLCISVFHSSSAVRYSGLSSHPHGYHYGHGVRSEQEPVIDDVPDISDLDGSVIGGMDPVPGYVDEPSVGSESLPPAKHDSYADPPPVSGHHAEPEKYYEESYSPANPKSQSAAAVYGDLSPGYETAPKGKPSFGKIISGVFGKCKAQKLKIVILELKLAKCRHDNEELETALTTYHETDE